MNTRWRLDGKHALVTGGTKGIGKATAEELLNLGATVTITARNAHEVGVQIVAWREAGFDAHGIVADVASEEGRASIVHVFTQLDLLIHNAGTNIRKPTIEYTDAEYATVFRTNLDAVWSLNRSFYPLLKASDSAAIVHVGSVAGSRAVMSGLPYALTKAAIDQMTRFLAVEWAVDEIRVNAVNPWYTNTPLAAPRLADEEWKNKVLARTPNERIAEPEDVASVIAFLCLPAAHHVTGQSIAVDGGFLADGLR